MKKGGGKKNTRKTKKKKERDRAQKKMRYLIPWLNKETG